MSEKNFRAEVLAKSQLATVLYALRLRPNSTKTCACKSTTNVASIAIDVKKVEVKGMRLTLKDHVAKAAAQEVRHAMRDGNALCESCLTKLRARSVVRDAKGQILMLA